MEGKLSRFICPALLLAACVGSSVALAENRDCGQPVGIFNAPGGTVVADYVSAQAVFLDATGPSITGVTFGATDATLTIKCTGQDSETLEILYKDFTTFNNMDLTTGWKVAATAIATNGNTTMTWIDQGNATASFPMDIRSTVNTVAIRYYLVTRQDYDDDADNLPNARETYVYGTNKQSIDTDADRLSDYDEVVTHGTSPILGDTDGDGYNDYIELNFYGGTDPKLDTDNPGDEADPSTPTNFTDIAIGRTAISFSWDASTDPNLGGIAGYLLCRNGVDVARTQHTSFVDSNLTPGVCYTYSVCAYDLAGNKSTYTVEFPRTTFLTGADVYIDAESGNDASDGSTWETAKKTLSAAIAVATDGQEILVGPGTYAAVSLSGKNLKIFSRDGPATTIIDCTDTQTRPITIGTGVTRATIIEGFTFQKGTAPDGTGGAALITSASPVFVNCVFSSSSATTGGGIGISGTGSEPSIIGCTIKNNSASTNGGGIHFSSGAKPRIRNCTVTGNTAQGKGAGICGQD